MTTGLVGRPAPISNVVPFILVMALAVAGHVIYSPYGFSPTDEGFTLAYSRRILDGEVPHRDFVSIRPALSPLLHVPVVALSGDHTFYISRLVVRLETAVIGLLWAAIVISAFGLTTLVQRIACCLIPLFLARIAPFAWHTTDGILLSSLGFLLSRRESRWSQLAGFFLVGSSYLAKQNFAVLAIGVVILAGQWRRPASWLAVAAPGILYVGVIALSGGFMDLLVQMRSQTDLVAVGVLPWLEPNLAVGVALGLGAGALLAQRGHSDEAAATTSSRALRCLAGLALLAVPLLALSVSIFANVFSTASFVVFGVVLGLTGLQLARERRFTPAIVAGLFALALGWTASISVGNASPSHASGMLAVVLAGHLLKGMDSLPAVGRAPVAARIALCGLVVAAGIAWVGSQRFTYRDRPIAELNYPLAGVLPGASALRTNADTYAYLKDLQTAAAKVERYALVADGPAVWVKSRQRNPLSIDWPQGIELNGHETFERVVNDFEAQRGLTVFVQKVAVDSLAAGVIPRQTTGWYSDVKYWSFLEYVIANRQKVGETKFFELYE